MAIWQVTSALAFILTAVGWGNGAAAQQPHRHHVAVDLISDQSAAVPGKTITVAVRERMEPGWHTYWENPGDSGEPTHIDWNLQDGISAGPVLWPLPHTIAVGPLVEYGYDGEVLLLTAVQIPENAKDNVRLGAKVSYLVCKDICVPEETRAELTLPVANQAGPSEFSDEIAQAKTAVPMPLPGTASYAANPAKGVLRLTVSGDPALFGGVTDVRFFPLAWGAVSNSAPQASKVEGAGLFLIWRRGTRKKRLRSCRACCLLPVREVSQ